MKIIGVGQSGIDKLNQINDEIKNYFEVEFIDKDIDKDTVRNLLDDVEVLFLVYDKKDSDAYQIVNAVSFMAKERNILNIGLTLTEDKKEISLDNEFLFEDRIIETMKMMSNSLNCELEIDLSDLKEVFMTDKKVIYITKEDSDKDFLIKDFKKHLNIKNNKEVLFIEGNLEIEEVFEIYKSIANDNTLFSFNKTSDEKIKLGVIKN
ncbi:MAG: hypothetical protein R3Y64_00525 [Peptostreptococcaceae bacterium]